MPQESDLATAVSNAASDIGGFIRAQREAAQVSVRQLAEKAGVSNPYLSQIERGLRRPSAEVLNQIAKALRVSAEVLYVRAGILDRSDASPVRDAVIQLLCDRAFEWALGASDTIDRVVVRDSPSWTPKFVDHFVGDRIYRELVDFTDKVRRNPEHDLRQSVNRLLYEFADDLQHDDLTIAKAEAVKARLMARAEVQNAAATAWSAAKKMITESVDDPSSELRTRIADTVVRIGETLRDDASVRDKVDGWVERAARHLVDQYGAEITAVITETIERWDADEASRRIELHVGRDLQFIRINGTVVGSLAGLIIYTVAQLLF
ncbi:transmembrane protein [Mycobacteroides abscessus subsp. abscessus]|nr:transmembrane protein [Mycobacteroides abscessus subsp. abscessus]